jgi:ferric-dicitrate binding protein FerR (iron transport regulator)
VTLAPHSVLRVAGDFGAKNRTVTLDGQAFFAVQQANGSPFVVRTGTGSAKVLGTEFVVRRYSSDATMRVAVLTGKVLVATRAARLPGLTLVAGGVGEVTDSTASIIATGGANLRVEWRRGSLVFNETPVGEVLSTLSRWYGVEFRMTDSALIRRHVTAVLSLESFDDALATLRMLLEVDVVADHNLITLTPRRGVAAPARSRGDVYREFIPNRSEVGR